MTTTNSDDPITVTRTIGRESDFGEFENTRDLTTYFCDQRAADQESPVTTEQRGDGTLVTIGDAQYLITGIDYAAVKEIFNGMV